MQMEFDVETRKYAESAASELFDELCESAQKALLSDYIAMLNLKESFMAYRMKKTNA